MTLRQKMLLMLSLTVMSVVAAVGWLGSVRVRHVFEDLDQQQTTTLVNQFQREFSQRASDTAEALDRMASSDPLRRIAFDLSNGGDSAAYLTVAVPLAQEYRLDYLELVAHDGGIISSLQWTARFGYKEPAVAAAGKPAFLKEEDLPDGSSQIGLFATRVVAGSDPPIYVTGGRQLDANFLRDVPVPAGTTVYLYRNLTGSFHPGNFIGASGPDAEHFQNLVDDARDNGRAASGVVYVTAHREDSVNASAIPLKGLDGNVLAVLVVANSRRSMVVVQNHIRDIAYGVAGLGIIAAVLASLWIAARLSRPIEELARAAGQVAAGDWDTRVDIRTFDEVGMLARSFNNMTRQLSDQRERLLQSERVAAWRELARRLAHELKNPLFPLQITVENMIRAHQLPRREFDEVFGESTVTLQAEIANLKTIVGRFSDFSKMPRPVPVEMDAREAIRRVVKLYGPALEEKHIELGTSITSEPLPILGDSELLHRALSNLVLNAMDAMPDGGSLTVSAARASDTARISIADSGAGLTPEECERLFTPYYTTKTHGTGLGLAIVQSVVADHQGTVAVESVETGGARFVIGLPLVENGKFA
ncbi:MAG TPA: HAMP domain-containing sensor histidine kinase [Acidobacteriaceae bacterium]|jgi:signal transduction histidine kinase|nr:HAMP domain-containing sensor histidine kinase [Acidobacteriaceae bacterium]